MNRVNINTPLTGPHFIGCWFIEPLSLCGDLVNFFETQQGNQTAGRIAGGLDLESKNSIDLSIRPRDLALPDHQAVGEYLDALFACHKDYLEQWPFLKSILPRVKIGSFNIQRYQSGGHFQKLHSERTTVGTSHRVLAWMTYLNDVEEGGSTHFSHQNLDIKPEQGKTLIWPAEWTHSHLGNIVNAGSKYIITGWMHFPLDRETPET